MSRAESADRPSTIRCVECDGAIVHEENCAAVAVLEGENQYGDFEKFDAQAQSGILCGDCLGELSEVLG